MSPIAIAKASVTLVNVSLCAISKLPSAPNVVIVELPKLTSVIVASVPVEPAKVTVMSPRS